VERATATQQTAGMAAPQRSAIGGPRAQAAVNPWFRLHQNVGNQAMSRLLRAGAVQAKLHVSQPGDADESEADRAAEQVVGTTAHAIHRDAAVPAAESRSPTLGLIVEDEAPSHNPGQMKKSVFLDLLEADICAIADAELAASGRSSANCPYIAKWMAFYRNQSSAHIERALLKYAPETAGAVAPRDYIRDIRSRVRRAVVVWAKTGRITGIPPGIELMSTTGTAVEGRREEGFGTRVLRAVSGEKRARFKQREGAAAQPTDAESVRNQLGQGRHLDSRLRTRMESAFGVDFSSVRVHDDAAAWELSSQLNARALTVGNDIAFSAGEYKPGTPVGDALVAHELAHVVQQGAAGHSDVPSLKGEGNHDALEEDADVSAIGAIASLWTGVKRTISEIGRNAGPRLRSGLKLQRCTFEQAPKGLKSAEAKAAWIAQAMKDDDLLASQEIVKMFKSSATQKEFLDIQKRLDMEAVIDYLRAWDAIQVGAIGPLISGAEKLNEIRADYIVEAANDYSLPNAMVFTIFIFNTMYTDDMRSVLRKLAANKRIGSIISKMDPVLAIIKQRGLNIDDYKDPPASAYYFGRGVVTSVENLLGSSELSKGAVGQRYFNESLTLPEEYQAVLGKIEAAEFEEAMKPGNIVFGTADYLTFGIPGSVYGLVRGTIGGAIDLGKGNYEEAGGELTGALILILSYAGVKVAAKIRAPATSGGTVMGPKGVGQFVLEEPKAVPKAVSRLNAIVTLGADGEAAATALINRLGESGVVEVGRYIQADSKAARFVYENGVEGAEALHKAKGNLAEAGKLLPKIPKLQLPPPGAVAEPPPPAAKATIPPPPPAQVPKPAEKTPSPAQKPATDVGKGPATGATPSEPKVKPSAAQQPSVDKADAARKTADEAKQTADAAKQELEAKKQTPDPAGQEPGTSKTDVDAAQQKADAAKRQADAKAADAAKQQTKVPPEKETPSAADTQKRLDEIRKEKSLLDDAIREKYEKKGAAQARSLKAAARVVNAKEADKQALRDQRDRNATTAARLQEEIDELRIRRNALAAEEARLVPRVVKPQTWQEAEDALRKEFSGQKKTFVRLGENREVDCSTADGMSREAKFGPQGLTDFIKNEINKDVELRNTGAVKAVEWHFYENVEGGIGPSSPLADALRNNGIRIVLHK
jgi:Domain of unknown function (DUF4157)